MSSTITTITQLQKEDLLNYLTMNPGKPVYVVEDKNVTLRLSYDGIKNKLNSQAYVPGTENTVAREVDLGLLKTVNYWKPNHKFYTTTGIKVLLDSWDKEDPRP